MIRYLAFFVAFAIVAYRALRTKSIDDEYRELCLRGEKIL